MSHFFPVFWFTLFQVITLSLSAQPGQPDTFRVSETEMMYKYTFCILAKGPSRNQPEAEAQKIQEGHMQNLSNLEKSGYLWLAGPFDFESQDMPDWRGIVVLRAPLYQAKKLMEADPAVSSGRLSLQCKAWWTGQPWFPEKK